MPEPPKPPLAAALASLKGPQQFDPPNLFAQLSKHVQNYYFKDQTIALDGYMFTNCCFRNCKLVTHTGVFALKSCFLFDDCDVLFGRDALRVVHLYNMRYGPSQFVTFNPTIEPDGSITLE